MDFKGLADNIKDKAVAFIKKQVSSRTRVVLLILCASLLLVNFCLLAVMNCIIGTLPEQLLADRWSENGNMAQISLFTTQDVALGEEDMRRFEYTLEKKLLEAGVWKEDEEKDNPQVVDTIGIDEMNSDEDWMYVPEERTGIKSLYSMAYSAQGIVTVSFENRIADSVSAFGVGGDFFLFHPMTFVSGSGFSGDDLMKDRIVIDEDMAWQLFGSIDIVGQTVMIADVPHIITGVVSKDRDRIRKAAGLDKGYIYMSYDSLTKYGYIMSGRTVSKEVSESGPNAEDGGISCVEVVCPNPVRGLALKMAKESIGLSEGSLLGIDNTARFSFLALLSVIASFGKRSMWSMAIYYPYWENAARGYEDILALILLVRIICVLTVVVIFVISIVNAYRNKTWTVRSIIRNLADKKYDWEAERKLKKLGDKTIDA
jgi:hypothetical protein